VKYYLLDKSDERLSFLNDTVVYFGSKTWRRSVDGESYCRKPRYKTSDGRCCAIGRHIPAELHPELLDGSLGRLFNVTDRRKTLDYKNFLPERICLLGINFLNAVSCLHDRDQYWTKTGLSYLGQQYYNWIIKQFCEPYIEYENHF